MYSSSRTAGTVMEKAWLVPMALELLAVVVSSVQSGVVHVMVTVGVDSRTSAFWLTTMFVNVVNL